MASRLFEWATHARDAIVDVFVGRDRSRMRQSTDELQSKLADARWTEDVTDNSMQKTAPEGEEQDTLAGTVYRALPQNPFSDDF